MDQRSTPNVGTLYEYYIATLLGVLLTLNKKIVDFSLCINFGSPPFDDIDLDVSLNNGNKQKFKWQIKHKLGNRKNRLLLDLYNWEIREDESDKTSLIILYTNVDGNNEKLINRNYYTLIPYEGDNLLLNMFNRDGKIFRPERADTDENDFLKRVYIYTNQKQCADMDKEIHEVFDHKIKNNHVVQICHYVQQYAIGKQNCYRLTKEEFNDKMVDIILRRGKYKGKLDESVTLNNIEIVFKKLSKQVYDFFPTETGQLLYNMIVEYCISILQLNPYANSVSRLSSDDKDRFCEKFPECKIFCQRYELHKELSYGDIPILLWKIGKLPLLLNYDRFADDIEFVIENLKHNSLVLITSKQEKILESKEKISCHLAQTSPLTPDENSNDSVTLMIPFYKQIELLCKYK